jgi:type II secretory pathway pseudopilin PulG
MRTVRDRSADGFSLVEVIVSTGILTAGLLSLAGVFTLGVRHAAGSSASIIAREKAREAVESVHTARDTGDLSWAKIRNVAQAGVFLAGAQPIKTPGLDGLINTADDGPYLEQMRAPGPDKLMGTSDDVLVPLTDYTREIQITDLMLDADPTKVNPNLRQIKVIVKYKVTGMWRTYTLTTYVSSFK